MIFAFIFHSEIKLLYNRDNKLIEMSKTVVVDKNVCSCGECNNPLGQFKKKKKCSSCSNNSILNTCLNHLCFACKSEEEEKKRVMPISPSAEYNNAMDSSFDSGTTSTGGSTEVIILITYITLNHLYRLYK